VLVYVRVYSGSINRNAALWNTNLHVTERAQRLLQMHASDAEELAAIPMGQIGVIAGLKHARTGDTLISYPGVNPKTGPPGSLHSLQLRPIEVPPPVFFAAIEASSLSEEKNVADILGLMLREDPSLHVNIDEESGQMLLSGMGELHLEIARDRLVGDYKAKATMGKIEIGYRECVISETSPYETVFDREVAGRRGKAGCSAVLAPFDESMADKNDIERDGNIISVLVNGSSSHDSDDFISLSPDLPLEILRASLANGAAAALARGPRRGFPLHAAHVTLNFSQLKDFFGADTTPAALASAARFAVQGTLKEAFAVDNVGLMEPVMNVVISCDESSLGAVVHDISSARGGHILSLGDDNGVVDSSQELMAINPARIYAPPDPFESSGGYATQDGPGQQRHITARVPLKEMVGYLKHLRSLTGGRGSFIMSVDRFDRLSGPREKAV
jgi:elongation factor G